MRIIKEEESVRKAIIRAFFVLVFIPLAGVPALRAEQKFEDVPELIEEGQEKIPDQTGETSRAASDQGNPHER